MEDVDASEERRGREIGGSEESFAREEEENPLCTQICLTNFFFFFSYKVISFPLLIDIYIF
jgi:hypothetical protein